MSGVRKRWTPSNWASLKPFGIGEQRPNNYLEILNAIGENRDELPFAWRILTQGVCDGCALGTAGLRDWTLDGIHLCNIRLRLLRLNTMGELDPRPLEYIVNYKGYSGARLRELGRLGRPMLRRKGDRGFRIVSWDEALTLIAARIRAAGPERFGVYMTSRGMPNESYYAAQKAVRAMGSNNIDNAARVCHSPSTVALKKSLGVGATTCSYSDWLKSDLIVFIGSNVANNQPVTTKYLHYAKKNGARIAVINPYREPGMERYWIPSNVESALFGTKLADRFFSVDTGGDCAFLTGVIKVILAKDGYDHEFVRQHTEGFKEFADAASHASWLDLEEASGSTEDEMTAFAKMVMQAERSVFVWSMGITQHVNGVDNVQSIVNLALLKGFVGREGCGLMPIRGHSGVQGGAEMGAYATAYPGGLPIVEEHAERLSRQWGFEVPAEKGLTAPETVAAAHEGELDVLFSVGGNFLDVLPDPDYTRAALERVPLRVHMDLVVTDQMLCDTSDAVLLLPAATRYETPGGVTETTTERRVIFSPEIRGRRIGEARPEWEVFLDLARRVRPELAEQLTYSGTAALREEIAAVVPLYSGIEHLHEAGHQFQYGGPHLCADWTFPTPSGKAHFAAVKIERAERKKGAFLLSTRRGKQFNSMVHEDVDALTGASRDAVLMNERDADAIDCQNGDPVVVVNGEHRFEGRVLVAHVAEGNIQLHWPEGNILISRDKHSPEAGIPDYNAVVTVEKG